MTKYQNWLIVAASAAESVLMILFGLVFLVAPNLTIFRQFQENHISIPPLGVALLVFACTLFYPAILSKYGRTHWSVERRHLFFNLGGAPIYLYFGATIYINVFVMQRFVPSIIFFGGLCVLFLMMPSALFYGYQRTLEKSSVILMIVINFLVAVSFAFMPTSVLFSMINRDFNLHLVPMSASLNFLAAAIGYIFLLILRTRLTNARKMVISTILAIPTVLYGLQLIYNVLRTANIPVVITPLGIFDLSIIIVLLWLALYQPNQQATR